MHHIEDRILFRFRENVARRSVFMRDQKETPLERAVYWTEYVIRHKGAPHLRTAGRHLNFFQYHSIDVLAFLLLVLTTVCYSFWMVVRCCCGGRKSSAAKKKRE